MHAISRHSVHVLGRTLATGRSSTAAVPASSSARAVAPTISAIKVRSSEFLPTPDGPTIKSFGPLFCARRSSAVKIFMARPPSYVQPPSRPRQRVQLERRQAIRGDQREGLVGQHL